MKTFRFRTKGLWLAGTRAEVQDVKKAHRKPCYVCDKLPKVRRLMLRTGSGRSAVTQVLCAGCGVLWVEMTLREGRRAIRCLEGSLGDEPIRLGGSEKHTKSIWLKRKLAPKPKPKT